METHDDKLFAEMNKAEEALHPEMIKAIKDLITMMEISKYQKFLSSSYEIFVGSKLFDELSREMRKDYAGVYTILNDFLIEVSRIEAAKQERYAPIRKKYGVKTWKEDGEEKRQKEVTLS